MSAPAADSRKRKKQGPIWRRDGFVMRLAEKEDAEAYYRQNFCPLDQEVVRFTGCKPEFSREEVVSFFCACAEDPDRYDFLILSQDGRIAGESVLHEIDWELRQASFRIALFQKEARDRGIGSWATENARDFAFGQLKLHRLELEVYSFNPRGKRVYEKAGFQVEGVLRDAVKDGSQYADVILMAMLEQTWKTKIAIKGDRSYG